MFDCGGALFIEHNPVVVLTAGVTATSRVLPVLTCDSVGGHASDNAKPEQCQPPPNHRAHYRLASVRAGAPNSPAVVARRTDATLAM